MFYQWVADGAAFGIKAFFAVFVFGAIIAVGAVLLSLGGKIMEELEDAKKQKRD